MFLFHFFCFLHKEENNKLINIIKSMRDSVSILFIFFIFVYISPQINRAEKNKSYFYNCYGKEEKFYIENQG